MFVAAVEDKEESPNDTAASATVDASNEEIKVKRSKIAEAYGTSPGVEFIRRTATRYSDSNEETRIVVRVSKRYIRPDRDYWYGFFDKRDREYLEEKKEGHFIMGCTDSATFFVVPIAKMKTFSKDMSRTSRPGGDYCHVEIKRYEDECRLVLRDPPEEVSLTQYEYSTA